MNSYNPINGIHASEHRFLNNEVLKGEWGFDGILMSDWISTYDAVGCANGGLDLEMPNAKFMNRANLLPAINDGRVKVETIDDKLRRILRTIIAAGFLDRPQRDPSIPAFDPFGVRASLAIARESIVLLSNKRNMLPFDRTAIKSIAVIGPQAHPKIPCGGGSSHVTPLFQTSILDGIRRIAGDNVEVFYNAAGCVSDPRPIFAQSAFTHYDANGDLAGGLEAEYFTNTTFSGNPAFRRIDNHINFDWYTTGRPQWAPDEGFSIRWSGVLRTPQSGTARLYMRCDDGLRVFVDGKKILDDWGPHGARTSNTHLQLKANTDYALRIEYNDLGGRAAAQFGWEFIPDADGDPAVALARKCDAVVLCVGLDNSIESEGSDRPFELPADQRALIGKILCVNRKTVVVLTGGGSVGTEGWRDTAAAIVHALYPGQEGGRAIAEALFGDINPSGKLPFSFDKRIEDNPAYAHYHSSDGKHTFYREGIFVGYRGYDRKKNGPLFPFGHGLSYTAFEYSNLSIGQVAAKARAKTRSGYIITCDIKNTGKRAGAEVVQLYVRDVKASVDRPVKELKGFTKIFLKPGQKKRASISFAKRDLAFYDIITRSWVTEPGQFEILVGSSSRDIRLKGSIRV
jgi:beta-glucosidase